MNENPPKTDRLRDTHSEGKVSMGVQIPRGIYSEMPPQGAV
jgi:hypothetical protein